MTDLILTKQIGNRVIMLTLSVKGKYGLSAMFELALQGPNKPVQLRALTEAREIPHNYLEQIMIELKRDNLVKSFRGAHGGYILARPPKKITIKDILTTLEGNSRLSEGHYGCNILNTFWKTLEKDIKDLLTVSLEDLIKEKQKSEKVLTYTI